MADAYTDACHAMRRWKTTIKTVVSGFSLPVASFPYPARKKSLILVPRDKEKPDTQATFTVTVSIVIIEDPLKGVWEVATSPSFMFYTV